MRKLLLLLPIVFMLGCEKEVIEPQKPKVYEYKVTCDIFILPDVYDSTEATIFNNEDDTTSSLNSLYHWFQLFLLYQLSTLFPSSLDPCQY